MKQILRCWVVMFSILFIQQAFAQDKAISGTVTSSDDGSVLPGVSITAKGTSKGITTDGNGKYKITVPQNATLIFSFLGFETQSVSVATATTFDVVLITSAFEFDEVVTTAQGINQRQGQLGYSVQTIKGDDVADTQRPNFMTSLQGRAAGLNMTSTSGTPGASTQIQLRGVTSIGGNNSPLIVVDGLPSDNRTFSQGALVSDGPNRGNDYMNRAGEINPQDIESITILKGPEAAALYGQDGASGAIIIVTKKAKKGRPKVDYSNSFGFAQVYRTLETQRVYGRGFNGAPAGTALSFFGAKYGSESTLYNNLDSFYQTGKTQIHNLGIAGGTDAVRYRFSTTYTNQGGVVPTTNYERLSMMLRGDADISPKLDISTSFQFLKSTNVKPIRGGGGFYTGLLAWPANDDITNYQNPDGTRRRLLAETAELDNPLFSLNRNVNQDRTTRTIGRFELNYKPTKWLKFTGRFGPEFYSTLGNLFINPQSNLGLTGKGTIDNYVENGQLLTANLLGSVNKTFGKFTLSTQVGGDIFDNRYEVNASFGQNLYLSDFNSINNTDPLTQKAKLTLTRLRRLGAFAQMTWGYNDMLYVTVTGRRDWSSTLPKANNTYFYPSINGSFEFAKLPAFKDIQWLTYGKIRASYAEVGKDAPAYRVLSSLTPQTTTGGGFAYGVFGGNEGLTPERGKSFEIGAELKFVQNRLGVNVSYYQQNRFAQIVSQRLSYGTGFILGLLNGGNFYNSGVEVEFYVNPVKKANFNWTVEANFTKLKTTVNNLPAEVPEYYNSDTWLFGNARASAFVGNLGDYFRNINLDYNQRGAGSALAIGGYSYLRNPKGDILINPTSGLPIINTNFLPIGDRTPDFTIGLTNRFRYKNINLSFLLDIRKGGDVFNGNAAFLYRAGLSTKVLDRETPVIFKGVLRDGLENSETPTANTIQISPLYRSDFFTALPESEFVEKNINWLRMRDITLSYGLPDKMIKPLKVFRSAGVFVTGTDLFLLTNYTGADPNVNGTTATSGGAGAGGFDYGTIGMPRNITAGVRLGF
ncbi:MAG: SusC/RagA family TonB-linked outer membrane protein [Emticicia sp.]|nr:SusC/RagA family TonB-linked outer membrane protein [Emticicia sp.]